MTRRTDATAGPLMTWAQSRLLAERLRPLRQERRLALADIALEAGVSRNTMSLLMRGACRWRERDAAKAAALLGATLADLLGDGAP